MKTKMTLIAVMILGFLAIANLALAGASKTQKAAVTNKTADAVEMEITPIDVKGVMEKSDSGLTLFDGKNTYMVKADKQTGPKFGKELEQMAGKMVKLKGSLQENEQGALLVVTKAVVAQ